jgi:hypothetical protein
MKINGKLSSTFRAALNIIDREMNDFNEDLKQIAHTLTVPFIRSIYQYFVCLLSKRMAIE